MANRNSPYGFKPIKKLDSSPFCGEVFMFYLPSTDAVDMFPGDLVNLAGSSNSAKQNGFQAGTMPTVVKATAGATNRILGAIVDVYKPTDIDDSLRKRYRVASTNALVMVALANNVIFSAQADEDIEADDIGSNIDYVVGSGGDTVSAASSAQVDSSTVGAGATLQLKLLRIVDEIDNELGSYCRCEVLVNLPAYGTDTIGV